MIKTINTNRAPQAIGVYSQARSVDNLLFISGQIPLDKNGNLIGESFEEQAHQVFKNLSYVVDAGNSSLENGLRLTIYLQDLNNFARLNEIMAQYFNEPYPARAAVQVARLPKDVLVEIDGIFVINK